MRPTLTGGLPLHLGSGIPGIGHFPSFFNPFCVVDGWQRPSSLQRVLTRRILWLVAALLVGSAVAASFTPRPSREKPREGPPIPPAAAEPARVVEASLGESSRPRVVRARRGELVRLTVTATRPDTVTVEGYDRLEPAEPGTPAKFEFRADRVGSFPVRLRESARTVGRLDVADGA